MKKTIDFSEYINGKKVLAGRDDGEALRELLKLEELETNNDIIEMIIPNTVKAFNSSYFLGTFGRSVRNLGRTGFIEKYIFQCTPVIKKNIEDGINEALNNDDVFED